MRCHPTKQSDEAGILRTFYTITVNNVKTQWLNDIPKDAMVDIG